MVKKESNEKPQKTVRASENIGNENLDKLREVFPQFVKDGEIDFDALKAFFDKEGLSAGDEKYGLSWAGKSDAFRAIRTSASGTLAPQREESKNWEETGNLFLEGDNLEVLKLLQKQYREQIKMIYIDPPYNTGGDFIYKDNFHENKSDYYERTGQTNSGVKLTSNTESGGRYHSDWLTMMYPRLFLAKNLLKEDGVIFISIDDHEVHNLRHIVDEIFGEENFIAQFIHKNNSSKNQASLVSVSTEYFLCYAKKKGVLKKETWRLEKKGAEDIAKLYKNLKEEGLSSEEIQKEVRKMYGRPKYAHLSRWNKVDEHGVFVDADLSREGGPKDFTIKNPNTGEDCLVPSRGWGKSRKELLELQKRNLIWYGDNDTPPRMKSYILDQENTSVPDNFWYFDNSTDTRWIKREFGSLVFENPKPVEMIKQMIKMVTRESDTVLDFFVGSGTTPHAILQQNAEDGGKREWICVQIPEIVNEDSEAAKAGYKTIAEIARERIHRAGEGIVKEGLSEGYYNGLREVYGYSDKEINKLRSNEEQTIKKYLDVGFKSLKLNESNYREWKDLTEEDSEETLKEQMKLFAEKPLIDSYDEESVVYEVLLKEGYDINSEVKEEKLGGLNVWIVTGSEYRLVVSFAKKLTKNQIEALGLDENDTFVCFDYALDDETKVNITRNLDVKVI